MGMLVLSPHMDFINTDELCVMPYLVTLDFDMFCLFSASLSENDEEHLFYN